MKMGKVKNKNENRLEILIEEALKEEFKVDKTKDIEVNDNIIFSERHESDMKKLFAHQRRKELLINSINATKKIAVIFIALFISINILTLSVEAIRIRFLNYKIEQNEKYTEITFNTDNKYISNRVKLMYIPANFKIKKEDISDTSIYLKFEFEDKYFSVSIESIEGTTQLDTENSEVKSIKLKEWNIMMIQKDNEIIAYWVDNKFAYSIYGNITENDIVNIINNLKNI